MNRIDRSNQYFFGNLNLDNLVLPSNFKTKNTVSFLFFLLLLAIPIVTLADDSSFTGIIDIMRSNSVRGDMSTAKSMAFLGIFLSILISIVTIFSLFMVLAQFIIDIGYTTNPKMWDRVDAIQQTHTGKFLGYGRESLSLFAHSPGNSSGSGVGVIIDLILGLLPNIKQLSSDRTLSKDGNAIKPSAYIFKSIPFLIPSIFILSMSFNGQLMYIYSNMVDALSAVGNRIQQVDFQGTVENLINGASGYTFTLGADGTKRGNLEKTIASTISGKVMVKSKSIDQVTRNALCMAIERQIQEDDTGAIESAVQSLSPDADFSQDNTWGSVKVSVIESTNPNPIGDNDIVYPLSLFAEEVGITPPATEVYYHVNFSSGANLGDSTIFNPQPQP